MNKTEWTTEKPKEHGWYWAREIAHVAPPVVCRVHRLNDNSLVVRSSYADYPLSEVDYAEWSGPIPPPE